MLIRANYVKLGFKDSTKWESDISMPEEDVKKIVNVAKALNELRNNRRNIVFIGGNYNHDTPIFNILKETIESIDLIPIIANEIFDNLKPNEIHEESLRLLHNSRFALIDITHPAGQLMELERARDYNVITFVFYSSEHTSLMPLSLLKVMDKWRLGYIFKYDTEEGLQKFVKSIMLINHIEGKRPEEIIKEIVNNEPKELLLLTSVGIIDLKEDVEQSAEIIKILEKIPRKILLTGWDFKTRGMEDANKYNFDATVCENCILYTKTETSFALNKNFCDEESLSIVKIANKHIIYAIQDYVNIKKLDHIIFFSQANEKSICYYLNPPTEIRDVFEKYNDVEPCQIYRFVEKVKDECGQDGIIDGDKIKYSIPNDKKVEISLLYAIEKMNARYRTFHPYSISIDDREVKLDLNPVNDYVEFSYSDVENIVNLALANMYGDYEVFHDKIHPQKDICIDIFCKSKDEILDQLLDEIVNDHEKTLVVYLSKGTESDVPMIFSGYKSKYNFISIGNDDISERLKRAGVIPFGESITKVIKNIVADGPKTQNMCTNPTYFIPYM